MSQRDSVLFVGMIAFILVLMIAIVYTMQYGNLQVLLWLGFVYIGFNTVVAIYANKRWKKRKSDGS